MPKVTQRGVTGSEFEPRRPDSRALPLNHRTAFRGRLSPPSTTALTSLRTPGPALCSSIPVSGPAASHLRPQHTHLRWSKEWMLREDLPWPPPTQLRERPNMLAAPARRSPHGLMSQRPSGREPAAATQAAEVVKRPPTTFLPGPQPRTDIQPEPAVRPSRFTAAATRNAGKCSSPARPQPTGLCEPTTRPGVHRSASSLRPLRKGGARGESAVSFGWAGM